MTPLALGVLVLCLAPILFGSTRAALAGLLAGVLYTTLGASLDIAGLNLYAARILTLAACLRVMVRGEWSVSEANGIDALVLLAYGYRTAVYILAENGSPVYGLGLLVDALLAYFAARGLVKRFDDLAFLLRTLVVLLVPYTLLVAYEWLTVSNPFRFVGGIADHNMRRGMPRCLGSFGHASLLGTFAASFLPLFAAQWLGGGERRWALIGAGLCLALVFFSNSGSPLSCVMVGAIGWMLWPLRRNMPGVRLAIFAGLAFVAISMNAPVWFLPARLSAITGGGGWHRAHLMDMAFTEIDRWWLVGMSIYDTHHWFPYALASGSADLINYYIAFGIDGGLPATLLFILLLVSAYSRLGRGLEAARVLDRRPEERMLWGLGVVLTVHVTNWFGIVYFDQFSVLFFMQLAAIAALPGRLGEGVRAPGGAPAAGGGGILAKRRAGVRAAGGSDRMGALERPGR